LIIGDSCSFVHSVQAIQKGYDFFLIKKWNRTKHRTAERILHERALAIRPSQLDAQIFLANLLIDTGKVEQAVPLLRDALKTNPNYAAAHWELGYAYRFAGMLNESVTECEGARRLGSAGQGE
jgi:Tfp pilus assembly protein PilF